MIKLGSSSLKLRAIFWLYFPHSKKYSWRTLAQELPERSEAEALPRWLVGSCSEVCLGQSRGGTFLGVILWGRGDQTLHHRIIMLKQQEVIKPAAAASSHSLFLHVPQPDGGGRRPWVFQLFTLQLCHWQNDSPEDGLSVLTAWQGYKGQSKAVLFIHSFRKHWVPIKCLI